MSFERYRHCMRYPDVLFYLPLSYRTNDTARRTYVLSPLKSGVGVHLCDDKQRAIRSRMQRFELFFYHFQSCQIFLQTDKFFFAMLRMECERCWPQILDAVFFRTPKNNSRWKIGNWQQKTNQDNFRRLGTTAHRTKSANLISFFFLQISSPFPARHFALAKCCTKNTRNVSHSIRILNFCS